MKRNYRAIFFDWDGTAVITRSDRGEKILPLMNRLLEKGIFLMVVSGTTYDNLAGGKLHEAISERGREKLYFGLGRGAFTGGLDQKGGWVSILERLPQKEETLKMHDICYQLHRRLLERYDMKTDIVFTRPNYCKLDLLPDLSRGNHLYLQPNEVDLLHRRLEKKGFSGGVSALLSYAEAVASEAGIPMKATTDAKYLEIGLTTKSDSVDTLLKKVVFPAGISIEECCFWGDEFAYLGDGIQGSDAYMMTELSRKGDFFDVSASRGRLPPKVQYVGGSTERFENFLREMDE